MKGIDNRKGVGGIFADKGKIEVIHNSTAFRSETGMVAKYGAVTFVCRLRSKSIGFSV